MLGALTKSVSKIYALNDERICNARICQEVAKNDSRVKRRAAQPEDRESLCRSDTVPKVTLIIASIVTNIPPSSGIFYYKTHSMMKLVTGLESKRISKW